MRKSMQNGTVKRRVGGRGVSPLSSTQSLYLVTCFSDLYINHQPNSQNGPSAPLRGCAAGLKGYASCRRPLVFAMRGVLVKPVARVGRGFMKEICLSASSYFRMKESYFRSEELTFLLKIIFSHYDAQVVRSREPNVLSSGPTCRHVRSRETNVLSSGPTCRHGPTDRPLGTD